MIAEEYESLEFQEHFNVLRRFKDAHGEDNYARDFLEGKMTFDEYSAVPTPSLSKSLNLHLSRFSSVICAKARFRLFLSPCQTRLKLQLKSLGRLQE